jgi:hypothetical protein
MGDEPKNVPALQQVSLRIMPLHTEYGFVGEGIQLILMFFTQSLPGDLDVLSRPVTYLTWRVKATGGKAHSVSILLDVSPTLASPRRRRISKLWRVSLKTWVGFR